MQLLIVYVFNRNKWAILLSFPAAGWMRFRDKCFIFKGKKNDVKANWSDARSWCIEQGAELAVIDNQYENGKLSRSTFTETLRIYPPRC